MLVSLFSKRYEVVPSILLFELFLFYPKIETICQEGGGQVSSPQLAERFRVPIGYACQVLRRPEEKGLLERQHRQYPSNLITGPILGGQVIW